MKLSRITKSDIGKIFLGNGAVYLFTMLQAIIISRVLGPTGKGEFAEILLWPNIVAGIAILGLYSGIVRLVAKENVYNRWEFTRSILGATLLLGCLGSVVSCLLAPMLIPEANAQVKGLAVFYSFFIIFNTVGNGFLAIDHGRRRFVKYSVTRAMLNPIFLVFIVVLFVCKKLDLTTTVVSLFMAIAIVAVIRVVLGMRDSNLKLPNFTARKLMKYSLRFSVVDFAEQFHTYFERAVVVLVLLSYDVGIFTTAVAAASVITIFSNVYGTKVLSEVAGGGKLSMLFSDLRQNFMIMGLSGIVLALALPTLIPLVFGRDFEPAVLPAILLIAASVFQGQSYVTERALVAKGHPMTGVIIKIAGMLVFGAIALVLYLCGQATVVTLVLGAVAAQAIAMVAMSWALVRKLSVSYPLLPGREDFRGIIGFMRDLCR